MRVVHGFEEGKKLLDRKIAWPWENPPASVVESTSKLFGKQMTPEAAVTQIVRDVKARGDAAVWDYTHKLDPTGGIKEGPLEVPKEVMKDARKQVSAKMLDALEFAAERVRVFHQTSMPRGWMDAKNGYGERYIPLERAGLYIPGGTAAYPSTVLMTAVPARVAGVKEIVMCSPAREGQWPHPAVLAAADLVGVDRVFRIGGAQAIAAMAYGTQSVPRVDVVCGPGNMFVTLAKKLVWGDVAVDGLYGPTETLVIADETASPAFCAADLIAQAEHDTVASPIFITTSNAMMENVQGELTKQLAKAPRRDIAQKAFDTNGIGVVVNTMEEALALGNMYAPEHISIATKDPWNYVHKVRNAGAVFVGEESPEVLGDYAAGPSHVVPTSGTARFNSPLGVRHFLKTTVIVSQDAEGFKRLADAAIQMAEGEGLHGHAAAAKLRSDALRNEGTRGS